MTIYYATEFVHIMTVCYATEFVHIMTIYYATEFVNIMTVCYAGQVVEARRLLDAEVVRAPLALDARASPVLAGEQHRAESGGDGHGPFHTRSRLASRSTCNRRFRHHLPPTCHLRVPGRFVSKSFKRADRQ